MVVIYCTVEIFNLFPWQVREKLQERIDLYDKDSSGTKERAATDFVDSLQETVRPFWTVEIIESLMRQTVFQMKCCGFKSYKDWEDNPYLSTQGKKVPESCCKHDDIDDPNACQVWTNSGSFKR